MLERPRPLPWVPMEQIAGPTAVLRRVLANRDLRRVLPAFLVFSAAEYATWIAILLYAY